MGQVTFEENYKKKQGKRRETVSKMTSFLIKTGLVKNEKQANYFKFALVVIFSFYIFWSTPSLIPYKFDGDLTKLPGGTSSYLKKD